jgi:propane monooxygenase small subunit
LATADNDWQRNLKWTKEFVSTLLRDPEHGTGNKKVIEGWLTKWLLTTREAMQGLALLFDMPAAKPHTFTQACERVEGQYATLLKELNLEV